MRHTYATPSIVLVRDVLTETRNELWMDKLRIMPEMVNWKYTIQ
jgi:hypothetical protein